MSQASAAIRAELLPAWWPDWSGQVCAVIASGASADRNEIDALRGRARVLVVNNSFMLAPWADALYAADAKWWEAYPDAHSFGGIKITADAATAKRLQIEWARVRHESDPSAHWFTTADPDGTIAHGGHGGFQALDLVLQFHSRRIILVGFDYCGAHWHDRHPDPLKNPRPQTLDKWRDRLDAQTAPERRGIEIVNASSKSELTAYRKMTVTEALTMWGV